IADALRQGRVAERAPLDQVARLIAGAAFVIGVDTGLLHLAAALGVPLVGIFLGSEPGLTGPRGRGPIAIVGGKALAPAAGEGGGRGPGRAGGGCAVQAAGTLRLARIRRDTAAVNPCHRVDTDAAGLVASTTADSSRASPAAAVRDVKFACSCVWLLNAS